VIFIWGNEGTLLSTLVIRGQTQSNACNRRQSDPDWPQTQSNAVKVTLPGPNGG